MQLFSTPSEQLPTKCTSYTCSCSTHNTTLHCPSEDHVQTWTNMSTPKAFLSAVSNHWPDCFKELQSYSCSPIWKLFIRMNKFTVKMDLWSITERSWKSGRGVPKTRDKLTTFPVLAAPSTPLETVPASKARYFLSLTSLSRKIEWNLLTYEKVQTQQ